MAAAVAGLAAALIGCGGGSDKDLTSGLDATAILAKSEAASKDLVAFKLTASGGVTARTAGGLPSGIADLLKGTVRIDGEGPVDDGSMSFDFETVLPGLPAVQANLTKVGPQLFVALLGTDYKVDAPAAQVAALQPSQIPAKLVSWATAPKEVGREDVGGEPTVHLTASVDPRAVVDDISSFLGAIQGAPVTQAQVRRSEPQLRAALAERRMDLWIGTKDLIPRRITARLRFAGRVNALPQLRAGTLELDTGFADIGKRTEITAPQTTKTLNLDQLRALAG